MKLIHIILGCLILASCTIAPSRPMPKTDYPDATTLPGKDQFNGGIMDNTLVLNGIQYDTVTPALADKVEKWQGNRNGFIFDPRFTWDGATAIEKAVMFKYDFQK
jgi:hypothetical protein